MIGIEKQKEERDDIDWSSIMVATLIGLAFLFHLIGLGSTRWASTGHEFRSQQTQRKEHIGLWRYCVDAIAGESTKEVCDDFINIVYSDWLKAVQSFMVLTFFTFIGSVGFVFLPLLPDFKDNKMIIIGASLITLTTGFFQLIAVVVFGCYYQTYFDDKEPQWKGNNVAYLDWSFVITCLSCVACIFGGIAPLVSNQRTPVAYKPMKLNHGRLV